MAAEPLAISRSGTMQAAGEPPMDLSAKQSVSIKEMPSDIQLIGILPEEGFGKVAGPSPLRTPKGAA